MRKIGNKPLTPKEKQRRRSERLTAIAQANGFGTWRKMETAILKAFENKEQFTIRAA